MISWFQQIFYGKGKRAQRILPNRNKTKNTIYNENNYTDNVNEEHTERDKTRNRFDRKKIVQKEFCEPLWHFEIGQSKNEILWVPNNRTFFFALDHK